MTLTYLVKRWRIFADYTTVHGVKEIHKAPKKLLRILWIFIFTLCASIMLYQICKLTAHFLTEPVTTTVTKKQDFYQLPLFLLVAHTPDLFFHECDSKKNALDKKALLYARSLIDKKVFLPDGVNLDKAKKDFEKFLNANPGLAWYDVLEPCLFDLSPWVNVDDKLRVVHRSAWNGATYHVLEPAEVKRDSIHLGHDLMVEMPLLWTPDLLPSSGNGSANLQLTSYGLMTDATRLEPGHIYKVRFDITSHRSVPLRRKSCRPSATQYLMYDHQICNETCLAQAEQTQAPRKCYDHSRFNWGFNNFYRQFRPCSNGFYNSSGGPFNVEVPQKIDRSSKIKIINAYENCYRKNCLPACEQLTVKLSITTRQFGQDLLNRSLLFVTWPAPNAVQVYDEALQYTWDSFVGQLGGLIGLWMGASMVSAFEAFYICCCCCFDVAKDDFPEDDEERNFGMAFGSSKRFDAEPRPDMINGVEDKKTEVWLPRNAFN